MSADPTAEARTARPAAAADDPLAAAIAAAPLAVQALGTFRVWRDGTPVPAAAWGRDKAVQLFQFLLTQRRTRLDKEQIVEALWPDLDGPAGDRDFKVALNAVQRALEPGRPARAEARFVRRFGSAYGLDMAEVWVDAEALEAHVAAGNRALGIDPAQAAAHYAAAADLYGGDYLPERRYDDWASSEHERLQVLALGAMTTLAELRLADNPLESLRLAGRVLAIDPVWEDAWRIEMRAHAARGNRALAVRAYERCAAALEAELGLAPLPETRAVIERIRSAAAPSSGGEGP